MNTLIPDDLSIPAFLKREDTPESKAARERISKQMARRTLRRVEKTSRSTISTGYAVPTDDAGKALLREVLKSDASELQKDRARRALRNARGNEMSTPGPKETALRDQRKVSIADGEAAEARAAPRKPKPNGKPPVDLVNAPMNTPVETAGSKAFTEAMATMSIASKPKESAVSATKTATKTKPEVKAKPAPAKRTSRKKAAQTNARTPVEAAKPSKSDLATKLLMTAKGATQEQLYKLTGWKHTGVKDLAKRAGKKWSEKDGVYRIF